MSTSSGKKSKSGQSRSNKPNSPNTTHSTKSTQSVNQMNQVAQNPTINFCISCHVTEDKLRRESSSLSHTLSNILIVDTANIEIPTNQPVLLSCAGCKNNSIKTVYCSIDCQKAHWRNGHRNECGKKKTTTLNNNPSGFHTFFAAPIDLYPSPKKIFKRPTQLFTRTPNRYLLRQLEYLESDPGIDYGIFINDGVIGVNFTGVARSKNVRSRDALFVGISTGEKTKEIDSRVVDTLFFATILSQSNCMTAASLDLLDGTQFIVKQLAAEFEVDLHIDRDGCIKF